jgi:hypothetical protein
LKMSTSSTLPGTRTTDFKLNETLMRGETDGTVLGVFLVRD